MSPETEKLVDTPEGLRAVRDNLEALRAYAELSAHATLVKGVQKFADPRPDTSFPRRHIYFIVGIEDFREAYDEAFRPGQDARRFRPTYTPRDIIIEALPLGTENNSYQLRGKDAQEVENYGKYTAPQAEFKAEVQHYGDWIETSISELPYGVLVRGNDDEVASNFSMLHFLAELVARGRPVPTS